MGSHINLSVNGEPFTRYVFGDPAAARPYFHPLLGPGGRAVTRRFPIETTDPTEPTDHPHHTSLWTAHGDLNGCDNWTTHPGHGATRFDHFEGEMSEGAFIAQSSCLDAVGRLLCRERLAVRVVPLPNDGRLIDWQVTLTAPDAPLRLGDTKEAGLCAVRVAAPLQENRGGRIETADGGVGEPECFGKPSRWCDYSGVLTPGDETVGIALLSRPESFRHPTRWFVRAYGLLAANPFGLQEFTGGAEQGEVALMPNEALYFHYAVVVHRGDAHSADIEGVWRAWSDDKSYLLAR